MSCVLLCSSDRSVTVKTTKSLQWQIKSCSQNLAMGDDKQVIGGRTDKIHVEGTAIQDSDVVIPIPVWLGQSAKQTPLKSTLDAPTKLKSKLKRVACGRGRNSQNYFWMHAIYYGVLSVAGTMSLWWCRGVESISFVDCTFNAVSALTSTGLSSVRLRDCTPLGLFTLMLLMLLGNTVFVSLLPVYVRRCQLYRQDSALNIIFASAAAVVKSALNEHNVNPTDGAKCVSTTIQKTSSHPERDAINVSQVDGTSKTGVDSGQGEGLGVCPESKSELLATCCGESWKDQLSRHETGLLERQALATLSWLVPIYMLVLMCFGFVCIVGYTSASSSSSNKGSRKVRELYETEEVNPTLTAIFLAISAFSNTGLSPLDENMAPFAGSPFVLVSLAVLILAGNTMFPPCLRFLIWRISTLKRLADPRRKVYDYLLQFPRRCYTLLFPPVHTLWLVATVVSFQTVDMAAFCALDWNAAALSSNAGVHLMDGLFQSLNTRSAGMNVLPLSSLSPPLLVLYISMMYISAYPVFLSRQDSRLARIDNANQFSDKPKMERFDEAGANSNEMSLQFSRLFTRDSLWIFVHVFLICLVELRKMNSDPLNYSIFSIVFEVTSAYGNVGLTLGYSCKRWVQASVNTPFAEAAAACKDVPYSFSGRWSVLSKLILVSCMLMGRHRSLPDDMDSAIPAVTPCDLCACRLRRHSDIPL